MTARDDKNGETAKTDALYNAWADRIEGAGEDPRAILILFTAFVTETKEHARQLERDLASRWALSQQSPSTASAPSHVERITIDEYGMIDAAPSTTPRSGETPRTDAWLKNQGRKRVVTTFQDVIDLAKFACQLERELAEAKNVINRYHELCEGEPCAASATRCIDDLPLTCEAVGGVLDMRIGEKVLAFATENCPDLWDVEKDRGRYRVTDAAVFAKAVAHELNKESEGGSTPLSRLLDEVVEEAINQGAEGVEENNSPDGGKQT